jgi:hypothetical protein
MPEEDPTGPTPPDNAPMIAEIGRVVVVIDRAGLLHLIN